MKLFGLIGYPLSHSFSREYFLDKFRNEGITDCDYQLFELEDISYIHKLVRDNENLVGFNITIPYKQSIIQFLDEVDETCKQLEAINCIKIVWNDNKPRLKGFNTDVFGFTESLKPLLQPWHQKALILGTGGSAKAVSFVLEKFGIDFKYISRKPICSNQIGYGHINKKMVEDYKLIINATPIGMFPETTKAPNIPYQFLTHNHLLYDLIYNPNETLFLKKGKENGTQIKNGLEMLYLQAERSWEIWNSKH